MSACDGDTLGHKLYFNAKGKVEKMMLVKYRRSGREMPETMKY